MILGLMMLVLLTLHTLLNALVYCFQLNTERGADANRKVEDVMLCVGFAQIHLIT